METTHRKNESGLTLKSQTRMPLKLHNISFFYCVDATAQNFMHSLHHFDLHNEINTCFSSSQNSKHSANLGNSTTSSQKKIKNIWIFFFYEKMACFPVFIPSLFLLFLCVIIKLEDRVTGGPFGALKSPLQPPSFTTRPYLSHSLKFSPCQS